MICHRRYKIFMVLRLVSIFFFGWPGWLELAGKAHLGSTHAILSTLAINKLFFVFFDSVNEFLSVYSVILLFGCMSHIHFYRVDCNLSFQTNV